MAVFDVPCEDRSGPAGVFECHVVPRRDMRCVPFSRKQSSRGPHMHAQVHFLMAAAARTPELRGPEGLGILKDHGA